METAVITNQCFSFLRTGCETFTNSPPSRSFLVFNIMSQDSETVSVGALQLHGRHTPRATREGSLTGTDGTRSTSCPGTTWPSTMASAAACCPRPRGSSLTWSVSTGPWDGEQRGHFWQPLEHLSRDLDEGWGKGVQGRQPGWKPGLL